MNRVEIKSRAKEMIRGNKWYILKPALIIALVTASLLILAFMVDKSLGLTSEEIIELFDQPFVYEKGGIISSIVGVIVSLYFTAFTIGYAKYILSFVRGTKLPTSEIFKFANQNILKAFLVNLVVSLIITGGFILLIIPGIIASIGFIFYQEVCADAIQMPTMDIVHRAWNITKGHKMFIFLFILSFIGWMVLAACTLGLLYIWLFPYMTVSFTLVYEELRKQAN